MDATSPVLFNELHVTTLYFKVQTVPNLANRSPVKLTLCTFDTFSSFKNCYPFWNSEM